MESSPPLPTSLPEELPSGHSQTAIPEGLSAELTVAPFPKRVLAYCVDWGILGAAGSLFFFSAQS